MGSGWQPELRFDFGVSRVEHSIMRSYTTVQKVESLMVAIGKSSVGEGRIYFTGGVSAVLCGWRETTIDVDVKFDPEPKGIFESIPALKERLDVNIELAAPDQFIPPLRGWRDRSRFIAQHGNVEFYHYDFYSQALAKIERGHRRDACDVASMLESNLVEESRLWELFLEIESDLIRFPSIDPEVFRQRVFALTHE